MQAKQLLGKKNYMLRLTVPIFLTYLLNMMVNTVDQVMVGNYSQAAVSSVGNANQISWFLTMFFTILNVASVILVTQFKGADNPDREKVVYVLSVLCNAIVAVAVSIICLAFGRQIFTAMKVGMQGQDVLDGACTYLNITGGTIIFMAMVLTYSSFLRSNSIMNWPLIVTLIMNIVNIIGNYLLIFGIGPFPELGVAGAAWATAISRVIGCVMLAVVFHKKVGRLEWSHLRPFPIGELRRMLRIGLPSAGETISYNVSQLTVMVFINAMGLIAVNTKIYTGSVASFAYIFAFAMGEATQVVVGYMIGERDVEAANRRVMKTLRMAVLSTMALSAIIWLFSDQIIGIFMATSGDADISVIREQILGTIKYVLLIDIFLEFGRACNLVMVKALQTAGDIAFPVVCNVISSWVLAVPLSYLLGVVLGWGIIGVWCAFCIDECTRGIALLIRWKTGKWRKIDLIADTR